MKPLDAITALNFLSRYGDALRLLRRPRPRQHRPRRAHSAAARTRTSSRPSDHGPLADHEKNPTSAPSPAAQERKVSSSRAWFRVNHTTVDWLVLETMRDLHTLGGRQFYATLRSLRSLQHCQQHREGDAFIQLAGEFVRRTDELGGVVITIKDREVSSSSGQRSSSGAMGPHEAPSCVVEGAGVSSVAVSSSSSGRAMSSSPTPSSAPTTPTTRPKPAPPRPQHVHLFSLLLYQFVKLGHLKRDATLFKAAAAFVERHYLELFPRDIALIAWSFATAKRFGGRTNEVFFRLFPNLTKHGFREFSTVDLTQLFFAYSLHPKADVKKASGFASSMGENKGSGPRRSAQASLEAASSAAADRKIRRYDRLHKLVRLLKAGNARKHASLAAKEQRLHQARLARPQKLAAADLLRMKNPNYSKGEEEEEEGVGETDSQYERQSALLMTGQNEGGAVADAADGPETGGRQSTRRRIVRNNHEVQADMVSGMVAELHKRVGGAKNKQSSSLTPASLMVALFALSKLGLRQQPLAVALVRALAPRLAELSRGQRVFANFLFSQMGVQDEALSRQFLGMIFSQRLAAAQTTPSRGMSRPVAGGTSRVRREESSDESSRGGAVELFPQEGHDATENGSQHSGAIVAATHQQDPTRQPLSPMNPSQRFVLGRRLRRGLSPHELGLLLASSASQTGPQLDAPHQLILKRRLLELFAEIPFQKIWWNWKKFTHLFLIAPLALELGNSEKAAMLLALATQEALLARKMEVEEAIRLFLAAAQFYQPVSAEAAEEEGGAETTLERSIGPFPTDEPAPAETRLRNQHRLGMEVLLRLVQPHLVNLDDKKQLLAVASALGEVLITATSSGAVPVTQANLRNLRQQPFLPKNAQAFLQTLTTLIKDAVKKRSIPRRALVAHLHVLGDLGIFHKLHVPNQHTLTKNLTKEERRGAPKPLPRMQVRVQLYGGPGSGCGVAAAAPQGGRRRKRESWKCL